MARARKHPAYFAVRGYQSAAGLSDEEMAKKLNMSERTYHDKVFGYSDFSLPEAIALRNILKKTLDEIFLV